MYIGLYFSEAFGLSFAGSSAIAALRLGRKIVCIENDHWQFLQAQIRVVEALAAQETSLPADDAQKNQVENTAHTGDNPRTFHFAVVFWLWV